jgi:hypothetical protein
VATVGDIINTAFGRIDIAMSAGESDGPVVPWAGAATAAAAVNGGASGQVV